VRLKGRFAMHAPDRIEPQGLSDYLSVMSRAVFEPGLSWRLVESKWPGIVEAFDGFDPKTVAAYSPADIGRLMTDPRVIRNRRKIEAVIHNAAEMLALDGAGGGFRDYLRSMGSYEELVADLKSRFRFLGDSGTYHFLYSVGEAVPGWEQWLGDHPGTNAGKWGHSA
jgi:3-methyladenine DNA glycosylase Tag